MLFEYCRVLDCLRFTESYRQSCSMTRTVCDYEIDLHLIGGRTLDIGGKHYELEPYTCAIRRPGDVVTGAGDRFDSYCLTLDLCPDERTQPFSSRKSARYIRKLTANPVLDSLPAVFGLEHPKPACECFEALCRAAHDSSRDLAYSTALVEKLLLFLASESITVEPAPTHRPEIERALEILREGFAEDIRIGELAKELGFGVEHFIRLFTRECGSTPAEFLIRLRIDRSRHLLRTTDLPITEIALRSGFHSLSFFSLTFRKRCGMSPSTYRESQD